MLCGRCANLVPTFGLDGANGLPTPAFLPSSSDIRLSKHCFSWTAHLQVCNAHSQTKKKDTLATRHTPDSLTGSHFLDTCTQHHMEPSCSRTLFYATARSLGRVPFVWVVCFCFSRITSLLLLLSAFVCCSRHRSKTISALYYYLFITIAVAGAGLCCDHM